jgi:hypothetical protein
VPVFAAENGRGNSTLRASYAFSQISVENRDYHHLSQTEIASDERISQHLFNTSNRTDKGQEEGVRYFAWAMSWATLELGPTGSTNRICWGLRYMRSGSWCSLPRLMSTLLDCLVSGFVCVAT